MKTLIDFHVSLGTVFFILLLMFILFAVLEKIAQESPAMSVICTVLFFLVAVLAGAAVSNHDILIGR